MSEPVEDYTELAAGVIRSAFADLEWLTDIVERGRLDIGYARHGGNRFGSWWAPLRMLDEDIAWFGPTGDFWLWAMALRLDSDTCSDIADKFMERSRPVRKRMLELADRGSVARPISLTA